jgi:2-polyprenyl-3-methyl-5-hydroxy-6-metoxy-1,4-benzoquinol methylase
MSKIVREENAKVFETVYEGGWDKMYPSVDLVRLESWYFNKISGRAMDYGCGPGTNGLHLLDSGYEVLFTDVARKALKKVENKLSLRSGEVSGRATVRPVDLSADTLPDTDQSYEYIVCMSVLGNLEGPKSILCLLKEFFRILRPGGKMIVDINAEDTSYVHEASNKVSEGTYKTLPRRGFDSGDVQMYFPESSSVFSDMVEEAGFVVDDIGHSSFSYLDHKDYEFIICAHKPNPSIA